MTKRQKIINRYPQARVKAISRIFSLVQNDPGWNPPVITVETLKTLSLSPSKETITIFTLKFLGVIDQEGRPTEEYDNLRTDYSGTLERLIEDSYSTLLSTIPSSMVTQATLVNFFIQQGYSRDTAEYQAKLFAWLCEQAEIKFPNIEASFKRAHNR